MPISIQEILKKINSTISRADLIALGATALCLLTFASFLQITKRAAYQDVDYIKSTSTPLEISKNSSIFASVHGTTYTFSWCGGSGNIKESNKIYFSNESEAKASGRTLSKLCK